MKITTLDNLIVNLQQLQEIYGNLPLQGEVELRCVFQSYINEPFPSYPEELLHFWSRPYTCKTIGTLEKRLKKEKKLSLRSALGDYEYNKLDKSFLVENEKLFKLAKAQNIKSLQRPMRCLKIKKIQIIKNNI